MRNLTQPKTEASMGRTRGSRNVSEKKKFAAVQLQKQNVTHMTIVNQLHISINTITDLLLRDKLCTVAVIEKNRGSPVKLQPRCSRKLLLMVKRNRFFPIQRIASMFRTAKGDSVCVKTIRRICHDNGVRNYSAVSKPYLTNNHIASRLK